MSAGATVQQKVTRSASCRCEGGGQSEGLVPRGGFQFRFGDCNRPFGLAIIRRRIVSCLGSRGSRLVSTAFIRDFVVWII
jgi:hypothetical protein